MDASQLLRDVWPWLPTFRVVAETPHLPTAARRLHVTAPAVSRTLRLLEDRLGQPLFNRAGRALVLNGAGERLLGSVQRAAHEAEAGVAQLAADPFDGPLRIASLGVLTNSFVLPAALGLVRRHPALQPSLQTHRTAEANDHLARGRVDVAFYYEALTHEALVIERLGTLGASVYCGRAHPLYRARRVTRAALLDAAFSVPQLGDSGLPLDGWPVDVPRRVGMRIELLTTNLEVCLAGDFVTVLPDVVARPHLRTGALRRLPFDALPPIEVYAARRRTEASGGRVDAMIAAVRALVAPRLARRRARRVD